MDRLLIGLLLGLVIGYAIGLLDNMFNWFIGKDRNGIYIKAKRREDEE